MNSSSANNFLLKSIQPSAAPGPAPKHNYQDDQAASFTQNFKDVQADARAQQEDVRARHDKLAKPATKKAASADKPEHDPERKPASPEKAAKEMHPNAVDNAKAKDAEVENKKTDVSEDADPDQVVAGATPAVQIPQKLEPEALSLIPVPANPLIDAEIQGEVDSNSDVIAAANTLDTPTTAPGILASELLQSAGKQDIPLNPPQPLAQADASAEQGPLTLGLAGQGLVPKSVTPATPLVATTDATNDSDTAPVLASMLSVDPTAKTTAAPTNNTEVDPKTESAQTQLLDPKASFEKAMQNLIRGETSGRDESQSQAPQTSVAPTTPSAGALDSLLRFSDASAPAARSFVVQTAVPVPLGQPQWSQQVGEKVLWLAAQNISSAEINLNPEHLGPMQVKVSVHQEQTTVSFTSHHAVVREVLDQNLGRLRDMFSEQGLNLLNVDVSDKSFSRQQGEAQDQKGQAANKEMVEEETPVAMSLITQQRLVDHYA
jgi:flagellar hook-length control protein FliK